MGLSRDFNVRICAWDFACACVCVCGCVCVRVLYAAASFWGAA